MNLILGNTPSPYGAIGELPPNWTKTENGEVTDANGIPILDENGNPNPNRIHLTPEDLEENGAPSTPFEDEIPNPSNEIPKYVIPIEPPTTQDDLILPSNSRNV